MTMRRVWISGSVLSLAFTLCVSATSDGNDTAEYRYTSPITLPETVQSEELAQVLLTPEMFAVTQDSYADIRIVRRDTGQMVPCLVESVTQEQCKTNRIAVPLSLASAAEEPDGRFRVTLLRPPEQANKPPPLQGLTVKTPLRDFERLVQVETSEDGNTWKPVVQQARIFDVSSFADLRMTDIPLPPVTESHIHIRLTFDKSRDQQTDTVTQIRTSADGKGEVNAIDRSFKEEQRPFRIDRVDGWRETSYWERGARPLRTREIRPTDAKDISLKSVLDGKVLMPFEASRVPLESLTIDSPERILNVPYELYVEHILPDDTIAWHRVTGGVLERVAFRDYLSERMTITWHPTRAERYCLVVPDTAPVLTFAEAKGPDYRVVFPYAQGDRMDLLLGNDKVKSAGFNADQIKMLMRTITQPLAAEPSPLQQRTPHWRCGTPMMTTYILFAAIALTVLVLAFALISAMRRLPQHEE